MSGICARLGRRPEPVRRAVREPGALEIGVKGEAHAEHARLLLPVRAEGAAHRALDREPPHHGEAPGMQARRLERQIVAITFPRGRNDHDPLTPAVSISARSMSLVTGYGFCARCAPPGHGRSGVSAPQMCTCESTISISWVLSDIIVASVLTSRVWERSDE